MKALLGSLLFLATLVTACNATCTFQPHKGLPNQPLDRCLDSGGSKHYVGAYWIIDCEKCYCEKDGIICCTQILIPMGYDQEKCKTIFHHDMCSYTVVEKKNPEKSCHIDKWIL